MTQPINGPDNPGRCFIGLMSGTSMDGVDGVLLRLDGAPHLLASVSLDIPPSLRATLLALNSSGPDELHRAALAANELARLYAQACAQLRQAAPEARVRAIGAHGQTVRHRPDLGYTVQLNAPALLAELSGIDVVADFRSRDVAAGGQGAPLVPPFHDAMFGGRGAPRAVLNLGGIGNVTLLVPGQAPRGFDTGPANVLLDAWCHAHTGKHYDHNGNWAATGSVSKALLHHLLNSEPWFDLPAPKSTGRDLFGLGWLHKHLDSSGLRLSPQDVQATLVELTAQTVARAIASEPIQDLLVCGGGARNPAIMQALARALPCPVAPTDSEGVPGQWVEAMAFAWLAQAFIDRLPAGLPGVTGARGPRVLGALYPAA
ncbi:anhydro-N-acetylmuramic acid kinase [Bordetella avium]|uniref:anhydro-N-acetylmuramic acid kinase n=1 Tax=Bordetella avium TaxID=521 RepID=UPI000E0C8622|nr:anhydro-N-acetylmuramic acid kinase [Bordetella avium]AZY50314.1 anhydro-N-acetylmuramic acid kinase [Bordetella avium]AZY53708.1 anhydro-N-acetylmuramic acid kinase [Bordetella avium]RIQ15518.1 anhydro-N-acetylmuramic acid kinase [Bordetella avium]RIQ38371.1 anhydro-N-acetylmuramic acid kinase [Bordetella avium]RIQ42911.1 anhydro-N-acetylmuramic acid kinase [Bordetella avium]